MQCCQIHSLPCSFMVNPILLLQIVRTRGQKKLQITPVVKYCHEEGLPVRHWPIIEDARGFDLGVVVSFGHMIPDSLIQCFPL